MKVIHRLIVELEIEAPDLGAALHTVDTVLDGGVFQDAINEAHYELDVAPIHVTSAVVRGLVSP